MAGVIDPQKPVDDYAVYRDIVLNRPVSFLKDFFSYFEQSKGKGEYSCTMPGSTVEFRLPCGLAMADTMLGWAISIFDIKKVEILLAYSTDYYPLLEVRNTLQSSLEAAEGLKIPSHAESKEKELEAKRDKIVKIIKDFKKFMDAVRKDELDLVKQMFVDGLALTEALITKGLNQAICYSYREMVNLLLPRANWSFRDPNVDWLTPYEFVCNVSQRGIDWLIRDDHEEFVFSPRYQHKKHNFGPVLKDVEEFIHRLIKSIQLAIQSKIEWLIQPLPALCLSYLSDDDFIEIAEISNRETVAAMVAMSARGVGLPGAERTQPTASGNASIDSKNTLAEPTQTCCVLQ